MEIKKFKFPPINRTSHKWWRHKSYSKGIKVKPTEKLMRKLFNSCAIAQKCLQHKFDYALFHNPYRLYRRGKNRCLDCGIKLYS